MNFEIFGQFLLAALWGGIVGIEREYRSKSAGFRTMIMISIGSCFFTMMSKLIGEAGNPDRIAANIVTGIGFLGAGVIFRGENRVNGITTAASIWAVAAVGMGIGAGFYFASASASILILFVLALLPYLEKTIDKVNQAKLYLITSPFNYDSVATFENLLKKNKLKFKLAKQIKDGDELLTTWQVQGHQKNHQQFINTMLSDKTIKRFEF